MSAAIPEICAERFTAGERSRDAGSVEYPNLVRLADDAVAYFPLGMDPFGASYSILLLSEAEQQTARRLTRCFRFGHLVIFVTTMILSRWFFMWPVAVCLDLLILSLSRQFCWQFAQRLGSVIPRYLSMRLYSDRKRPEGLEQAKAQNWSSFSLAVFAAAFGFLLGDIRLASTGLTLLPVVIESSLRLKRVEAVSDAAGNRPILISDFGSEPVREVLA